MERLAIIISIINISIVILFMIGEIIKNLFDRRLKNMARLNMNISNKLDKQMRQYIKDNDMTITTFLHLAISKYIENEEKK